jgi:hypothetical protein
MTLLWRLVMLCFLAVLPADFTGNSSFASGEAGDGPDSKAPAKAGAQNEAEKLFRTMEQRIVGAQTLQFSFEHEYKVVKVGVMSLKGNATIAQGNKALLQGEHGGLARGSVKVVSDGSKMKSTLSPSGENKGSFADTPKSFHDVLTKSFSRCGCYVIANLMGNELEPEKRAEINIDKVLIVSGFKLGPREKIGKADTQVIHYQLDYKGAQKFVVMVWIDLASRLPVKHFLEVGNKDDGLRVTTIYSGMSIDQKLDAKVFALTK